MLIYKKKWDLWMQLNNHSVWLRLRLKPAVALVDAVADASAREVNLYQLQKVPLEWKVVVVDVDASRANLAAALESTLADTAGEFLVDYGR